MYLMSYNTIVSTIRKSMIGNASLYTAASIIQKIAAFFYFAFIARYFGPEDIGSYVYALSISIILSVFLDFGLTPVLIRSVSQSQSGFKELVKDIFGYKIIASALLLILLTFLAWYLNNNLNVKVILILGGGVAFLDSLSLSFWGVMRGEHNLTKESFSMIFTQLVTLTVGIVSVLSGLPLYALGIALLSGSFFNAIYSWHIVSKHFNFLILPSFDFTEFKRNIPQALPFGFSAIFTRIYSYIDQILLPFLGSTLALGLYSAPYKMTFAFQFIPAAFAASVYPVMSSSFVENPKRISSILNQSMILLSLIATPIAFGIYSISEQLILMLYGQQFYDSIGSLRILIFSLIPVFLSFPLGALLNASHRQSKNTLIVFLTMILNIGINFILIPKFSHLGASIASLVSLTFLFSSSYYFCFNTLEGQLKLWLQIAKIILSGIAMWLSVTYIINLTVLPITILIGAIIYILALFVFRVLKIGSKSNWRTWFVDSEINAL